MPTLPTVTPDVIKKYQDEIARTSSEATAKRKVASLNKFFGWAEDKGHVDANPMPVVPTIPNRTDVVPSEKPSRNIGLKTWSILGTTLGIIIIIILLLLKFPTPINYIKNLAADVSGNPQAQITINNQSVLPSSAPSSTISANPAGNGIWNLYTNLKLTDSKGVPQVGSETISFNLYNSQSGGTPLYTSDPQTVTTDANGSALISLDKVPSDLFFQNDKLYLEPVIGSSASSSRIPISTANVAANLGGYFPANPDAGATELTVPVIDSNGSLNLASQSPAINAKNGNLLVQGQAVVIKAVDGGNGNVEINPDGNGSANFIFEGNKANFLNAFAPNLNNGSLYGGVVANDSTGYDLLLLQSGSNPINRFSVDALGNTTANGYINTYGDVLTSGTSRLTSAGALVNITGYNQNSGNFAVNQNAADTAVINKLTAAQNPVLDLTLDERGVPTNSNYSTLVLNRFNPGSQGMALLVSNGNAQFDGQVKLGNYAVNPDNIGTGSLVYNTTDNQVYVWNGTAWTLMGGGGGSSAFNDITSGTNTTATMIVGSGATFGTSGTGTIGTSGTGASNFASTGQVTFAGNVDAANGLDVTNANLTVGGANFTVNQSNGNITTAGDVAVNGGDITTNQTTFNLINTTASTLNIGGGATATVNIGPTGASGIISLSGGASDTGCTLTGSSGNLTCSGNITTLATSGTQGWWQVIGSDLSPKSSSYNLAVGGTDSTSPFYVAAGSGNTTTAGNLTVNGNTTLGDATSDTITYNGRVNSNILPSVTATDDLGSSSLKWNNVYAVSFNQNGNLVCDASGANCPGTAVYWDQSLGALYPINNSVDLLIGATAGATATTSAKFAFTGVAAGLPTASIAGDIANVRTYLTGDGNLATTNMRDLTLGSSSTGNVVINSRGSTSLTANAANLTASGTLTLPNSNTLTGVANYLQNSQGYSVGGGTTYYFDGSGNINANAGTFAGNVAVNGGSLTTTQTTANLFTGATTLLNIGPTGGNGSIALSGGSADTGCTLDGTTGNLTCSGNITSTATSGTQGWWQLNNKILSPNNSTYDLSVGGAATGSAFQVFGIENTAGDIAKLNSTVITTGNVFEATSSAITGGNIIKLGQGGDSQFTGNGILMDFDNTGGGGGTFTGNFLSFKNATTAEFSVGATGNITTNGTTITGSNLSSITTAAGLTLGSTTTLTLGGSATINGGTAASGGLTLVSTTNGTKGPIQFFSGSNFINASGNMTIAGDLTVNGDDIFTSTAAPATVFNSNATSLSLGGAATTLNFQGASSATVNIGNSGGTTAVNVTSGTGSQTFTSSATTGTGTSGAFVFKDTALSSGDLIYATASAITSGNIFRLGQGGDTNFTGNVIQADIDNTGQGGIGFTGNFLKFTNGDPSVLANAKYTLDSNGNSSQSGNITLANGARSIQSTATSALTVGGSTTGNITLDPLNHVAGGFVAPNTTNVSDLGTASLLWRNVYATSFNQNGNLVCDASGANCPAGAGYWGQTNGALYPNNNTVDLLIGATAGATATSSAKFRFTGVNSGLPTASISGDIANVSTYLTGDGNLATTNMRDLTLGSSSTGNVVINSRGSTSLTANAANLTASGTLTLPNTNTLTGVANYLQNSQGYSVGGGTTYYFDGSGNINANAETLASTLTLPNSNTLTGVSNYVELNNGVSVGGGTTYYFDGSGNLNANAGTFASTLTANGNTVLGDATSDTITYTGRVNSTINPSVTATDDLGSSSLKWNNVYAVSFNQNGNLVCDASGANCPAGAGYWGQTNGALYPNNNSVDVLFGATAGSTATSSAKFAFTGVNSGLPTASIAGDIANVAAYLTGDGNLATTNMRDLTLGGSSTGQVVINSRGSTALTANSANLTASGTLTFPNTNTLTGVANYLQNSQGYSVGGGTTYYFDGSGNINANAETLASTLTLPNSNTLTGVSNYVELNNGVSVGGGTTYYFDKNGNLNANAGTFAGTLAANGNTTLGDATSDTINFTGRVNSTINPSVTATDDLGSSSLKWNNVYAVAFNQNGNLVCDASGANCPAAGTNYWGLNLGALFPLNNTLDLLIGATSGSTATSSAKFAFTGVNSGLPTASIAGDIANVNTYLTGDGNLATTNMRDLTLGGSSTGQVILNSRGTSTLIANGSAVTVAGDLNSSAATAALFNTTTSNLTIGGAATTFAIGPTGGSGSITFSGGSADTGCTLDGTTGNLTCSGDGTFNGNDIITTTAAAATVFNTNATSLSLGGAATTLNLQGGSGATVNIGNANGATAVNVTSGTGPQTFTSSVVSGTGASGAFAYRDSAITSGDLIYANAGNPSTFAGNFLKFDNAATTKYLIDSAGDSSQSGNLTIGNGSAIQPAYGPLTLNYKSGANTWTSDLVLHDVSGDIDLAGGSGSTGCTITNSNGNITCSGNITSTATSGTQGWWQLNNTILAPANTTYDLAIGGSATGSAFQVFGDPTSAGDIAKITSSVLTSGNLFEATSSAITSGNFIKLGEGSETNFTGNGLLMDFDNTGGGSFTGNFLNFQNAAAYKFTVDSSGDTGIGTGLSTVNNLLTVGGYNSGTTSSLKQALISVDNNQLAQLEGGDFFGRVGLTQNQFSLTSPGTTWTQADSTNRNYYNVAMSSDGRIQTAVVNSGGIYNSTNFGATWSNVDATSRLYTSVAMSSDGKLQTAVISGGSGSNKGIYTSTNYGVTWTQADSTARPYSFVAMSTDGKIQTAVNEGNTGGQGIYVSTDYGVTWTQKDSTNRYYYAVAMSSDGKVQTAVILSSIADQGIYTSTNYGTTWTQTDSTARDYSGVAMSSDGKMQTAVVNSGHIYTSTNYGVTWASADSTNRIYYGVAMSADGKNQTAVVNASSGANAGVFGSTDYGVTWTQKDSTVRNYEGVSMSADGKVQTAVIYGNTNGQGIYTSYAQSNVYGNLALNGGGNLILSSGDTISNGTAGTITVTPGSGTTETLVTATATTVNLFNTVATTLSLGGAATTALNVGNSASATVINVGSSSAGNVTVRSGSVLSLIGSTNSVITFPNFAVDTSGDISGAGSLQIGSSTHSVGYSRFGTSATNGHGLSTASDVLFSGKTEFLGNIFLDNGTNNSFTIANHSGTGTIIFPSDPTTDFHTLSAGSWKVDNTQDFGKAAFVVNQISATNDLFDASASGALQFKIANNGDTTVGSSGLGKITVGTVDPPYTINGSQYATYLPGMAGVKEEAAGNVDTNEYVPGIGYRSVIDFNNLPQGSDLWLFSKTTNITNNIDSLVALLTPSTSTKVWYEVDKVNKKLAIYSASPSEVSYRLTGPRFDASSHPNARSGGDAGFVLNIPDIINTNAIAANVQALSSFAVAKVSDGIYNLKDGSSNVVDGVESIGNFVAANIKAGAITSQDLAANTFSAFQGTVDHLLITSGLVSANIQTALISPVPDGTDVTVQIGTATESGKFAIQNAAGTQVAAIDDQGNATFSGTVRSQNIDQIQAMLNQVATDQSVLLAATSSANLNATGSATIAQLITSDLYVTGQAALNSLSVTNSLTLGSDLVIGGGGNTINSLSAPLKIQSLAMAPVEIMGGLITIDTKGNMQIAGNLAVAGRIQSAGLTLKDNETATSSAQLLSLQDQGGTEVAGVNASGSASFSNLTTGGLTIAASSVATDSAVVNGTINTNATAGSATIPAGVSEITIKNPKVTDYSLVYVTPTSSTQNNVLYVKSKTAGDFVVGFTTAINTDANFNWWIVQVQ